MSKNAASSPSQPSIDLVDRLRNPNFAMSPTFACSFMNEAAERIIELENTLRHARNRIEYLGICASSKHFDANAETFLPAIDAVLSRSSGVARGSGDGK